MDNWSALFDGQTRYVLDINDSTVKADVLRFRGREALSEPFRWDIEFTSLHANIPPEQVLMKYASLRMRGGKNVHGVVTRLEWLSTSRDQSHYRLTLSSRLTLLGYTRQCAVFQNLSVPEVVEQVLRKHGLEGPDFEFRLERTYPARELITQWRETDLQFIQRILSEVGIYWRTEMDDVHGLDTCILADSQLNYRFDVQLPYSEPSGLFDGAADSVWDVRTWHNIATGTVATRDYNYRTATTPMDATVSVRSDAVTTGAHYRYTAPYRDAGDDTSPEPETESGAFYARIHHERELSRSARIHLFSNTAHLTPGQVLEAQGDVITALKEGVILTLVTFRGPGIPVCMCRCGGCLTPNVTVSARRKSRVRSSRGRFRPGLRAGKRTIYTLTWTSRVATGSGWTSTGMRRTPVTATCGCGWRNRLPVKRRAGTRPSPTGRKWRLRTATAILTCRTLPVRCMTLSTRTTSPAIITPVTCCARLRTTSCGWKTGVVKSTSNSPRNTVSRSSTAGTWWTARDSVVVRGQSCAPTNMALSAPERGCLSARTRSRRRRARRWTGMPR
ncbi:type VI secretion system tip protein VgrG [Salmonella enterica]|nr:type VI secretion system tip protein VgrG [Salmonella enterica]HAU2961846.1 type VI secretion system tip protein VgrG [Salmonella enterica subsp. diarizonae]